MQNPIANIIFDGEISPKVKNKSMVPIIPLLFNIVLKVLGNETKNKNINKWYKNWKEVTNLSLFTDDIIIYIENPSSQ